MRLPGSDGSVEPLLGSIVPRRFTPPLVVGPPGGCPCGCALSEDTSYGFDVIDFARNVLLTPLDEWEELAVIHAGELLPDGITPRFRYVLILVARQNGKTFLLRVLNLYWLLMEEWPVTLGLSSDRKYAKKEWRRLCDAALGVPALRKLLPPAKSRKGEPGVNNQTGEESLTTAAGCEYLFAATNRRAGRSLSIDRLTFDELREHRDRAAWDAATNAMNARPYAQCFSITNQCDDTGVVLDWLHKRALAGVETGEGDVCLLEWSAPKDCDVDDPEAWKAANPNLGRRLLVATVRDGAADAMRQGGAVEASFRIEVLCQRVRNLDGAVDPRAWAKGEDKTIRIMTSADLKSRIAACFDISPDGQHATLAAAAVLQSSKVRVEVVKRWTGDKAAHQALTELPALLAQLKPRVFGWFPNGPAAAVAAKLAARKGVRGWPPAGVTVEEIRGEVSAACMGFASAVKAEQISHPGDPLLDDHVTGAGKLHTGDTWRFSRKAVQQDEDEDQEQESGHCDGAYAAAGAVLLAQTQPSPIGKPRIITAKRH